jgi:general secretion pathway protein C
MFACFHDNPGMKKKWSLRLMTALLWALATASVVYWGLRLGGPGVTRAAPATAQTVPAADASARLVAIARVLGDAQSAEASPAASAPSRFGLLGVVAQGSGGAALLAIDGKPAKPYRVGSELEEGLLLQSVGPRHVVLAASASGPALHRLELPGPMAAVSAAPAAAPAAPLAPRPAAPQAIPAPPAPALQQAPASQNLQRPRSSWHPEQPRWLATSAAALVG